MERTRTGRVQPAPGQLWLSRPPFLLTAHVLAVDETRAPARITYELLDRDGSHLVGPVRELLDDDWWLNLQPLVRREG